MSSRTAHVAVGVVLTAIAVAVPVWAHHAFSAEFDANRPVQLKGTVTKMEWINPHAWIHIDVPAQDGEVEQWMVEGGTPNTLFRRGFTKKSLMPGHRDSGRRVPGEGRNAQGQRPQPHL